MRTLDDQTAEAQKLRADHPAPIQMDSTAVGHLVRQSESMEDAEFITGLLLRLRGLPVTGQQQLLKQVHEDLTMTSRLLVSRHRLVEASRTGNIIRFTELADYIAAEEELLKSILWARLLGHGMTALQFVQERDHLAALYAESTTPRA
jgi:hypothetical protein